jgi:hypothetical protein
MRTFLPFLAGRNSFATRTGLAVMCLLALLCGSSCTSVKTQGGTTSAVTSGTVLPSLTVVALDGRPEMRINFEHGLAEALRSSSTIVNEGYRKFPISEFQGDKESVRRKFEAAGVQFLLVTRTGNRMTSLSRAAGHAGGGFDWDDLDASRYRLYSSGGEIRTDLRLDSKLYRVSDAQVIWSAATDTVLDENVIPEKMIRAIVRSIASQLKRDGLVR